MDDRWVVFGGWAIEPSILEPVFGKKALYIDTNCLTTEIVKSDQLAESWPEILSARLRAIVPERAAIAGWSTGAMIAYGLAMHLCPRKLLLLSATPSFLRREGFPYGTRASVLHAMTDRITNRKELLAKFYTQCGLYTSPDIDRYSDEQLRAGLIFLEQANLLKTQSPKAPCCLMHGTGDQVVNLRAGAFFAQKIRSTCIELEGPHAFFLENPSGIKAAISTFFNSKPDPAHS